jgi:hypothetical protein
LRHLFLLESLNGFPKLTRTAVSTSQGVVVASVCTATASTKSLDLGAESSLQTIVTNLVYCLSDQRT